MVHHQVWQVLSSKATSRKIYVENSSNYYYEYYQNIALYNLNILNNCQRIFVNTRHFDKLFFEGMKYHKLISYKSNRSNDNSVSENDIIGQCM